jgi:phosphate transport system substrate-binding protein
MRQNRFLLTLAVSGALAFGVVACGDDEEETTGGGGTQQEQADGGGQETQELSGSIAIDGSSTVQPFAEAAAELFGEEAPNVRVTVGGSGTGDGFERFCSGEIQISDASRPIEDDEREACQSNNVEFSEVQVANDGIAVVTNPSLQVDCFTTQQLKRLLRPNSNVRNYSQLGGDFPDQRATFFTPGEESGTFDFFTEAVLETDAEQRTDNVQTSANDNQLLTGIEGTEGALGYVGFSYAQEAGDKVNVAQIDGGDGCVAASAETIQNGTYQPLARPIFMYPSLEALRRPEVRAFMDFTLRNHQRIAEAAKIVPMTSEQAQESTQGLTQPSTGS